MKDRQIKEHLFDFKKHLQDQGKAFNSIKTYMATIMGFYQEFDIDTPKIKMKNHETREKITFQDIVVKNISKKRLKKVTSNIRPLYYLWVDQAWDQQK